MSPLDVLIVDDHPVVTRMLSRAFALSGINAHIAENGEEGIRLFLRNRNAIACVLLDVNMPLLDGPTAFRVLRILSPSLPIAFMTGDPGPYSYEELEALGPVDIFDKPLPLAKVLGMVERLREKACVAQISDAGV